MRGLVVGADWAPRPGYQLGDDERERQFAREGSAVWRHPRWSIAQRPDPVIREDDDVIVRSRACGICGSDVHMYETDDEGYVLLPYRMRFPVAVGHELAGEVVEVGPGVTSLRPGDPVAVETMRYCDRCTACRRGMFNQCVHGEDNGFTLDGGMAEYVLTRERHARPLTAVSERYDEQDTYEIGALCEPTSVAFVGLFVRAGGFLPGDDVAVFGCGPIGLAAIALARCAGAAKILAFDTQAARCRIASALGADAAFDVPELQAAGSRPAAEIRAHTRGAGVAMAIEATGAGAAVFPDIEASLAVGGQVALLGVEARATPVRTVAYQLQAASAHGTMGHLGGFDAVIALHAAGRLDMRPIISARYPLSQGLDAIRLASRREDAKPPRTRRDSAATPDRCHNAGGQAIVDPFRREMRRELGGDVLIGPDARANTLIQRVRREIGATGPDHRPSLAVHRDVTEARRGTCQIEHRSAHAGKHVDVPL